VKGDETYRIDRQLSFHSDGEAYEKFRYSTDIKLGLTRSVFQNSIYFDEGIPEDHRLDIDTDLSAGERISEYLVNQLERNIENDIRMIILDSALSRLAQARARCELHFSAVVPSQQVDAPVSFYLPALDSLEYLALQH
jgi:hypothetical protein